MQSSAHPAVVRLRAVLPAVAVCGLALALYTVASLRERRISARCAVGALLVLLWGAGSPNMASARSASAS